MLSMLITTEVVSSNIAHGKLYSIQHYVKKRFNPYEMFYDRTRKRLPFYTGDCLIEVATWAGLTVLVVTICLLIY
jgi:hypothetical protein